jgi:hypothetical protein
LFMVSKFRHPSAEVLQGNQSTKQCPAARCREFHLLIK